MIKRSGNLFDTDRTCVGHGVNVDGVMGAGIAKEFKRRFPHNYEVYQNYCSAKVLKPGQCLSIFDGDHLVMNMASQDRPGANARYEWLFTAARDAARHAKKYDHDVIAIPMIGAGIGGLNWRQAEVMLCAVEILEDIQFEVWKYEPTS